MDAQIAGACGVGQVFGTRLDGARADASPTRMSGASSVAMTVALGVALVGGVIAWKLASATYRADIQKICDAEKSSGHSLQREMSEVTQWVRANLATPEGNELFSSLGDTELAARAGLLRSEATPLGIGTCPTVQSYQRLAEQAEYRRDLQHLCSRVTFPGFADVADDARLSLLEDWIETRAESLRTRELAGPLQRAPPAQRADVLRAVALQTDVFSCDLARVLEPTQGPP
jgi:hypothetical protein